MSNLCKLPLRGTERPVTEKVENPNTSIHERVRYIDLIRGKGEEKREKKFREKKNSWDSQRLRLVYHVPQYSYVQHTKLLLGRLDKRLGRGVV